MALSRLRARTPLGESPTGARGALRPVRDRTSASRSGALEVVLCPQNRNWSKNRPQFGIAAKTEVSCPCPTMSVRATARALFLFLA